MSTSKKQPKVLITGGAGFIGFHLAKYLASQGQQVVICDNFFRDKLRVGIVESKVKENDFNEFADEDLRELIEKENVEFILCDLSDKNQLSKLGKEYDYVYHLAAVNGTRFFYEYPHEVLRIDVTSTLNILDWFIKSKSKKILFASTCETYAGNLEAFGKLPIPTPEDVPLVISDIFNPRWSYAASKIISELFFINYSRRYNFDMVIARYNNLFGPREGWEHVIPQFTVRIIRKEEPFEIYGGRETRTFCYISDGIKASQLIMESDKTKGQIINVGREDGEIEIKDLAEKMFNVLDYHPREIEILPAPKGSTKRRCPDISKLKRLVDYRPSVSLEEGLKRTYQWYLKHPEPFFKKR